MRAFSEEYAYGYNFTATIKSRAYFLSPESRDMVGEFFAAAIHAAFSDTLGTSMSVESDGGRHQEQAYFSEPTNDNTDWPVAGQRSFRHTFDLVAQEGMLGQFFVITISKIVADTGIFHYFGADLELFPCPEYTPEFVASLGGPVRDY